MSNQSTSNNHIGGNGFTGDSRNAFNAINNGISTPAKMRGARMLLVVMALLAVLVSVYSNCEQYVSSSAKARRTDVDTLLAHLQELDKSASSTFSALTNKKVSEAGVKVKQPGIDPLVEKQLAVLNLQEKQAKVASTLLMLLPQPTDIIQQQIERPSHLSLTFNTKKDEQAERLRRSSEAYLMWVELASAKERGQTDLSSAMTASDCYQRGSEILNELVMPSLSTVVKERTKELTGQYERAEKLYQASQQFLQYMLAAIIIALFAVSYMMTRLTGRTLNRGLVFGGLCVAYTFCANPLWLQVPALLMLACSVSLAFHGRLAEYEFRGL